MADIRNPAVRLSEKVAHVRAAMHEASSDHHCHWPGCRRKVSPSVWGCRTHWNMLPTSIRRAIWREFRPGQEWSKTPSREYVAVAKEAEAWILENHLPEKRLL